MILRRIKYCDTESQVSSTILSIKAEVKIIFEGVETEAQALFLRSLPVEQGQGWYWQRPLHWRVFEQNYLYMAQ